MTLVRACSNVLTVPCSRDRLTFSKSILRRFIRDCVDRDAAVASPWVVKKFIADKYGVSSVMPDETRKGVENLKKGEMEKRKKAWEEKEGPSAKKQKKEPERALGGRFPTQTLLTYPQPRNSRNPSNPLLRLRKRRRRNRCDILPRTWTSCYLRGTRRRVPKSSDQFPTGSYRLETYLECLSPSSWLGIISMFMGMQIIFWWRFHNIDIFLSSVPLHLSTFTLDEFEAALRHDTSDPPCNLIAEAHATLIYNLRTVLFTRQTAITSLLDPPDTPPAFGVYPDDLTDAMLEVGNNWERVPLRAAEGREGWEEALVGCLTDVGCSSVILLTENADHSKARLCGGLPVTPKYLNLAPLRTRRF